PWRCQPPVGWVSFTRRLRHLQISTTFATRPPKLSQDGLKTEGDVAGNVFEEHPFGGTFSDDASHVGPEVAGVVGTAALSGGAEGLAGISGEDGIERPAEGPGVEGPQIIPDRGRGEVSGALGRNEDSSGPVLPLDEGASVKTGFGEREAQIQTSAACAEGQSVPGT
ncbi:hypothetical protein ACSSV8_004038, partial [Roseovarius sp. MBR-79]